MTCIIIPTRHEHLGIQTVLASVCRELSSMPEASGDNHEIIVIDDSDDTKTVEQAASVSRDWPAIRFTVVHRPEDERDGLTGAIFHGMNLASHNKVVVMDGDGQHPPNLIRKLEESLQEHTIVFASRYIGPKGDAGVSTWIRRRCSAMVNSVLTKHLAPDVICTDPLAGFFAADISKLQIPTIAGGGWKAGYLILAFNLAYGDTVHYSEIPFQIRPRVSGESKLSLATALHVLGEIHSANRLLRSRRNGNASS